MSDSIGACITEIRTSRDDFRHVCGTESFSGKGIFHRKRKKTTKEPIHKFHSMVHGPLRVAVVFELWLCYASGSGSAVCRQEAASGIPPAGSAF